MGATRQQQVGPAKLATVAVACAGVTFGALFAMAVAFAPPRQTATGPTPTPTVTVTESASPSPMSTPVECLEMLRQVEILYPAVTEYEQALGETSAIQNLTMQAILQRNYKPLNEARQKLIDTENDSIGALDTISGVQADLEASIVACRKALT